MKQNHQSGAAAVEFALVLPILLAIVFATIEFSVALYDKAVITDASREAARAGIVVSPKLTTAQIQTVAKNYYCSYVVSFATGPCTSANASVTVTGAGATFGNDLTVTVSFPYRGFVLGSLMGALGKPLTITSTSLMKNE